MRAEAYIDTGEVETTKELFDKLSLQKARIEDAVGERLEWDPIDGKKGSRISLYFQDTIRISEEERWPEAREWLIDALGNLRDAFTPELDALAN